MGPPLANKVHGIHAGPLCAVPFNLGPLPRSLAADGRRRARGGFRIRGEAPAGLAHEAGLGWHSLRRKFATDMKHVPLVDLCYLGGWKDPQTVSSATSGVG